MEQNHLPFQPAPIPQPPPPGQGYLDLHTHLLPDVDDGCRNLDQTLDCIAQMIHHGYRGVICTPHVWPDIFPYTTPGTIETWVAELSDALAQQGVTFELWAGGELRLFEGADQWMAEHGVPTLGDGPYVLIDHWGEDWPEHIDRTIAWLIDHQFRPILAHPERINIDDEELESLLSDLHQRGVALQGNFNSLGGGEGERAMRRITRWLREQRYALLAMDMHGPDKIDKRFEGLAAAQITLGPEKLDEMIRIRPRQILDFRL